MSSGVCSFSWIFAKFYRAPDFVENIISSFLAFTLKLPIPTLLLWRLHAFFLTHHIIWAKRAHPCKLLWLKFWYAYSLQLCHFRMVNASHIQFTLHTILFVVFFQFIFRGWHNNRNRNKTTKMIYEEQHNVLNTKFNCFSLCLGNIPTLQSKIIEFFLNVFTEFSNKNICYYSTRAQTCNFFCKRPGC